MSLALIIDDEADLCRLMQMTLQKMGIDSLVAYDFATGIRLLHAHTFDFCLTDLRLPDGSGLDIVKLINQDYPCTPVAVITAHGSMDLAIDALKLGAFDFVNKPLELTRLRQLVQNALKVAKEAHSTQKPTAIDVFASRLIGKSQVIEQLKATIQKLARSQAPVFLWGESGTGKEVVAKLIHDLSPRANANFVPVNCGAIPSELMESEFFGHKKGSFTGATTDKEGLFQQANGGTLFLDEVADLPLAMQVKLLRAIQEKKVRPIGGMQEIAVDVRLLSATHKNLAKLVETGAFRQDLYYRINVIEVKLPSLNERTDDILLLANHFLQVIAKDWGLEATPTLSEAAAARLMQHHYAGNVRELRNILERAITLSDSTTIESSHLYLPDVACQTSAMPERCLVGTSAAMPEKTNQQPVLAAPHGAVSHHYGRGVFAGQVVVKPAVNVHSLAEPPPADTILARQTASHPHTPDTTADLALSSKNLQATLPKEGLEEYLINQERQVILTALNHSGWNKTQAAKLLNTSFRSLRYRMKKLGIESEGDHDDD